MYEAIDLIRSDGYGDRHREPSFAWSLETRLSPEQTTLQSAELEKNA